MSETRAEEIDRLYRERPRNRFVRTSLGIFLLFVSGAWIVGQFSLAELFTSRRLQNMERFLGEIRPSALEDGPWDWGLVFSWAGGLMSDVGWEAAWTTIAIAVLAIFVAALISAPLAFLASRNLMTSEPFALGGRTPTFMTRLAWRSIVVVARTILILLRSLPEYIIAFLVIALVRQSAWPAVIALAIHNAGILGRLNGEVIENTNNRALYAMRTAGATRRQIVLFGIIPLVLPRFLLYLFYRWESCVREATVLGMLGFISLGFVISEARVRDRYDEFVFFILIGCLIVFIGDATSALARSLVRRAS